MIDINLLRSERGFDPEKVRESQRKRFASVELVDDVIRLDKEWIQKKFELDQANKNVNALQAKITDIRKKGESCEDLIKEKKVIDEEISRIKQENDELNKEKEAKLKAIGNVLDESVVVSKDELDSPVVRTFEKKQENLGDFKLLSHDEILLRLDGFDNIRGAKVAGHRGYFLTNWGFKLCRALINYSLDFLEEKKYTLIQPPFFMNNNFMALTAQLSDFDEQLYQIKEENTSSKDVLDTVTSTPKDSNNETLNLSLIATSEQPLTAFYANEWFETNSSLLPKKFGGFSTCFRKEAGAHGKDVTGLFRIHQFEKIEQFIICKPEDSKASKSYLIAAALFISPETMEITRYDKFRD